MQVMYTDVRCTRTFDHVSECSLPPLKTLVEALRTEKGIELNSFPSYPSSERRLSVIMKER